MAFVTCTAVQIFNLNRDRTARYRMDFPCISHRKLIVIIKGKTHKINKIKIKLIISDFSQRGRLGIF